MPLSERAQLYSHTGLAHNPLHLHTGKPLHHVWKLHMNANLELHRKLELCLRLSHHLEDILNVHPDEYVLPGRCIYGGEPATPMSGRSVFQNYAAQHLAL